MEKLELVWGAASATFFGAVIALGPFRGITYGKRKEGSSTFGKEENCASAETFVKRKTRGRPGVNNQGRYR